MPSVLIRGVVLSVVFTGIAGAFLVATVVSGGESSRRLIATIFPGIRELISFLALVFSLSLLAITALAYTDYRRRRYVFEADGLTEIRGVSGPKKQHISYDEIEDVSYTRSRIQRIFGSGTVRINDIDLEDGGEDAELYARYLRHPEMFYSELRSAITGEGATEPERSNFEQEPFTEDLSSLSGDLLAADTSSSYVMPRAVLHPDSPQAGLFGLLVGLFFSIFVVPFAVFFGIFGLIALGVDGVSVFWVVGAAFLGFVGLVTARFYRTYDGTQYELYDDHIRKITRDEKTSVQFSDVEEITRPGTGSGNVRLWERNSMGHVALVGEDDEELVVLEYVENPDEVQARLRELVSRAR